MKGLGWWALLIISHSWETHLFFITGLKLLQLRSRVTTLHQFGVAEELFPVLSSSVLTASSSLQNSQSWSHGSGGQLMALLYKSQGVLADSQGLLQTNTHLHTREPSTELAQTPSTSREGWPHARADPMGKAGHCLAWRYMEHFSVLCCQCQSAGEELQYSQKHQGEILPSAACMELSLSSTKPLCSQRGSGPQNALISKPT